jgi:hypothetical protein
LWKQQIAKTEAGEAKFRDPAGKRDEKRDLAIPLVASSTERMIYTNQNKSISSFAKV